jgi:Xaa-Pro aminopeptidase
MFIGIRESQVRRMMESALSAAGLQDPSALVLFGGDSHKPDLLYIMLIYYSFTENAALPHGSGTDRVLRKHDLRLIDTGGVLYGYHSDVTRVTPSTFSSTTDTFLTLVAMTDLRTARLYHPPRKPSHLGLCSRSPKCRHRYSTQRCCHRQS